MGFDFVEILLKCTETAQWLSTLAEDTQLCLVFTTTIASRIVWSQTM